MPFDANAGPQHRPLRGAVSQAVASLGVGQAANCGVRTNGYTQALVCRMKARFPGREFRSRSENGRRLIERTA